MSPVAGLDASLPTGHALLDALRAGDEDAFVTLLAEEGPTMLRLAMAYVGSQAVAEEVVQETWLAMLIGLPGFEGRSSIRTWLYSILTNRAQSRGTSEHRRRSLPLEGAVADETAERFTTRGQWVEPPSHWDELPEERLLVAETLGVVDRAIERLPAAQRCVVELRDRQAWSSAEVCEALDLSEGNQRVLLHRARRRLRAALEEHLK